MDNVQVVLDALERMETRIMGRVDSLGNAQAEMNRHLGALNGSVARNVKEIADHEAEIRSLCASVASLDKAAAVLEIRGQHTGEVVAIKTTHLDEDVKGQKAESFWAREKLWSLLGYAAGLVGVGAAIGTLIAALNGG